jgi:cell division protein FtsI (penicillin-binding protein 3)
LVKRIRLIRIALVVVMLLLALRLVQVQVLESRTYAAQAANEAEVTVPVAPIRGGIYARDGTVLVTSVPTDDIYADDFQVSHPVTEAEALSPLLGVSAVTLAAELHRLSGYVALARQVTQSRSDKITADDFPGITAVADARRVDPDGWLASPVLGTVNAGGQGIAGIEYEENPTLAGRAGSVTLPQSPSGLSLPQGSTTARTPSKPGTGIELTLDEPLQYETEAALAAQIESSGAQSGVAEVMDVRTGEILSMANLVATDRSSAGSGTAVGGGATGPATPFPGVAEAPTNLALSQLYEPGSVFKLVTFSAALQDGIIGPNTYFTVPDQISLDGSIFHDAETHPIEQLTATQILAQSSNIGTSEIAGDLGEARLLAQVKTLGFGSPTGLGFPDESPGLLASAAQWEPTDMVSLPIGQVDAVNAQQVLDAYNAVANRGTFVAPRLVRGTIAADGSLDPAPASAVHQVFSPEIDAELTAMLQQVVVTGTGTSAVVPGYTVAGKTGTAQIPTPGSDSYIPGAYMASFVGFAPANHPVLSAIIVLDRPTPIFGGTVAAPVFAKIMSYALNRYDIPTTPGAPTQAPSPAGTSTAGQTQDIT